MHICSDSSEITILDPKIVRAQFDILFPSRSGYKNTVQREVKIEDRKQISQVRDTARFHGRPRYKCSNFY